MNAIRAENGRRNRMTAKDYIDPKGYWCDPSGNIRRMSGEQEILATVASGVCSEAEWGDIRIGVETPL
jgi:hypothetical protein